MAGNESPPTIQAQNSAYKYQVGGSLQIDAPSYVERQADIDFYEGLKVGEFCYVLNSRQMGKSSLRVQTMRKLLADGIACGVIDITAIGSHNITPAEWYLGVIRRLVRSFTPKVKALTWWNARSGLSPMQRLSEFIEEVLLAEVCGKIVIFADEIDSILKLNFKDDFFALLRACYNKRADNPAYQRLTFALLGVATPYDLMTDENCTPFNIGRAIELTGFRLEEAQPLASGLVGKVSNPQAVLQEVLAWSGGQPFLTQKLCQLILTSSAPIPVGHEAKYVENLVRYEVIENWESHDEPEHLKTIRDRIKRSTQRPGLLLGLYQQILLKSEITADDTPEQMELRLSGLVVKQQGSLKVYNRIYASVFNQKWVDTALSNLRPYWSALKSWMAANYQDDSQLLRGQALRSAQAWAEGRSLSEHDYQFLAASLEVEIREHQIALSAEKNSRRILPRKRRIQTVLILILVAGTVIMGVRHLGLLQALELQAFDQLVRLRPDLGPDPRLLVVTITEDDFKLPEQQHRIGSLSDRSLALLLQKLEPYQPQAIGLDIYHDFQVDPNEAHLATRLRRSDNFIAICKVSEPKVNEPGVSPLAEIPLSRQGFSDFVQDPDGILRRQLIAMKPSKTSPCTTPYALSARLAFHYLEALGISAKYTPTKDLQLGDVVFKRLRLHMGGYQQVDDWGYQVLLNYRSKSSPLEVVEKVTLKDVLTGKVKPEAVKNRIIIIGITAQSAGDFFPTPYSTGRGYYQEMPGVIVHAQMVSQILSAVLDGRPLLWVWPAWGEALWVYSWSVVGGLLAWRMSHPLRLGLAGVAALGVLAGVSFVLLTQGGWVPLVPSALALVLTSGSVVVYTASLASDTSVRRYQL